MCYRYQSATVCEERDFFRFATLFFYNRIILDHLHFIPEILGAPGQALHEISVLLWLFAYEIDPEFIG